MAHNAIARRHPMRCLSCLRRAILARACCMPVRGISRLRWVGVVGLRRAQGGDGESSVDVLREQDQHQSKLLGPPTPFVHAAMLSLVPPARLSTTTPSVPSAEAVSSIRPVGGCKIGAKISWGNIVGAKILIHMRRETQVPPNLKGRRCGAVIAVVCTD